MALTATHDTQTLRRMLIYRRDGGDGPARAPAWAWWTDWTPRLGNAVGAPKPGMRFAVAPGDLYGGLRGAPAAHAHLGDVSDLIDACQKLLSADRLAILTVVQVTAHPAQTLPPFDTVKLTVCLPTDPITVTCLDLRDDQPLRLQTADFGDVLRMVGITRFGPARTLST